MHALLGEEERDVSGLDAKARYERSIARLTPEQAIAAGELRERAPRARARAEGRRHVDA